MNPDENYLIHYGVLGMKWGIRRSRQVLNKYGESYSKDKQSGKSRQEAKANMVSKYKSDKMKKVNRSASLGRSSAEDIKNASSATKKFIEERDSKKAKAQAKAKAKTMTDEELSKYIRRANLEKQYASLSSEDVASGHEKVMAALDVIGAAASVAVIGFKIAEIASK